MLYNILCKKFIKLGYIDIISFIFLNFLQFLALIKEEIDKY